MNTINVFDMERLAQPNVEPTAWDYITGGAEDEITLRENRAAFERTFLRPRFLVDATVRDLTTTIFGARLPMPLLLAPTAYQGLSHPEGEVETARAAGATGVPMILSTLSTRTMEDVAAAAGSAPLWFQLYMMQDMDMNEWLVRRAERNGMQAVVLTVDVTGTANRERDRRNQFDLPPDMVLLNMVAQTHDMPPIVAGRTDHRGIEWKQDLTWSDVDWLRRVTRLPILIKGLLTAEDALLAREHGANGVIVSNHGGRQLDGAPASLDALPEVVDAVGGDLTILLDSGVRRGADILKALALGAQAVCIGRPYVWGLAAGGAAGVEKVIEMFRFEFDMAMWLTGRRSVGEIDRRVLWKR